MRFRQTMDGSILREDGRVLYFSIPRFIRDICENECCFICGAHPSTAPFNDEHVLPDWVLRKYNLHSMQITLPNRAGLTYGRYTVPCCCACNALMAAEFEDPISKLVGNGYSAVVDHLKRDGPWLFFKWLALIFLKTHLKDRQLRFYLDSRIGDVTIADFYAWEELHHVHCIARSFFTGAELDPTVLGSLFVFPAKTGTPFGDFDYRDIYTGRSIHIRLGDLGIVAVLNDSCAASNLLKDKVLSKITGPLSPAQSLEVMARMAWINLNLKDRPQYASLLEDDRYLILSELPKAISVQNADPAEFGKLLYWCCEGIISALSPQDRDRIGGLIMQGKWTFLFDEHGKFLYDSMSWRPAKGTVD